MIKRRIKLTALLVISLLLTGCWSRRELEDLGFATLLAIDRAGEGQIEVSVQLAITGANGGGEMGGDEGGGADAPVWTLSQTAPNLTSALQQFNTITGKHPYWAHTVAIIIGEELAANGIAPILDHILRSRSFRFSTLVMVSKGPAKDLLEIRPKLSKMPAAHVQELNKTAFETSISVRRTLFDVLQALLDDASCAPVMPLLQASLASDKEAQPTESTEGEGEEDKSLSMQGLAAFQGDKLLSMLDPIDSRSVLWLRGESKRSNIVVEVPGRGYVVQGQIYARRVLKLKQDGDLLHAKIIVYQDGDLIEHSLDQTELDSNAIKELDTLLTAHIKENLDASLKMIQEELQADILGIGDYAYRLHPAFFKSVDWQAYFPTMPIEIEVHASFRRTGEMLQSPLTSKFRGK